MELNLPESVVYEKRGPIAIITMNRPEAMNSLTKEMPIGLEAAYDTMNTSNGYVVGRHNMRCRITAISEVDVPAMKEAERIALAAPKA